MKIGKILSMGVAFTMLISTLTACNGNGNNAQSEDTAKTSSVEVSSEPKVVINPFTGEEGYDEALLTRRPVAVMINNIKVSLPQSGIADADIIYEMPVEGPITRMMAVFSDYKSMPNTGSIRSARHDFVEIAKSINAIYLHFGGSSFAKEAIAKYNVDEIDGLTLSGTAFYKDNERAKTKSREHCWFSNGELLQAGINKRKFETSMEPMSPLFDFAKVGEDVMSADTSAVVSNEISAPITSGCTATFKYDATTKTYSKGQYGQPHIDTNYNQPVKSTNVFLLYTKVSLMSDNYHKEIDLSKGTGYYISNGKSIAITFKKDSVDDTLKMFDASGNPLKVNPGKSYVCVADNSLKEKLSIK